MLRMEDKQVFPELRMPRVKQCCCGCSLELGSKIIAVVHVLLVGGFMLLVFVMSCIYQYKAFKEGRVSYYDDFSNAFIRDEFAFSLFSSYVVFSLLLYYAAAKADKTLMVPWLFLKGIGIISTSVFILHAIYQRILYKYLSVEIFIFLTAAGVDAYQFVVVHSHYNELKMKDGDYE